MGEMDLRNALSGNPDALNALCRSLHPRLCRFFWGLSRNREDAQDLAQETLLAMLKSLDTYRGLPGKQFDGWVFRIGYNRFIDFKRKKTTVSLPEHYDAPDIFNLPDQILIQSEDARMLRDAMAELDDETRAMVLMRYELDMRYLAIAQALNTHVPRVKWRLNDAKKKLKHIMIKEGYGDERI